MLRIQNAPLASRALEKEAKHLLILDYGDPLLLTNIVQIQMHMFSHQFIALLLSQNLLGFWFCVLDNNQYIHR